MTITNIIDIGWHIKPENGWKIEDFPKVKESFVGNTIEKLQERGVYLKDEEILDYYQEYTRGHSVRFIASINGIPHEARLYRDGTFKHKKFKNKPEYYIIAIKDNHESKYENPETNPYNKKDWNLIDAWCYYPTFKKGD